MAESLFAGRIGLTNHRVVGGESLRTSRGTYVFVSAAIAGIILFVLYQFHSMRAAAIELCVEGMRELELRAIEPTRNHETLTLFEPTLEGNRWEEYLVALSMLAELVEASADDGSLIDRVLTFDEYVDESGFLRLDEAELEELLAVPVVSEFVARLTKAVTLDSADLAAGEETTGVEYEASGEEVATRQLVLVICNAWVSEGRADKAIELFSALAQLACDEARTGGPYGHWRARTLVLMHGFQAVFGEDSPRVLSSAERLRLDEVLARLEHCFDSYAISYERDMAGLYIEFLESAKEDGLGEGREPAAAVAPQLTSRVIGPFLELSALDKKMRSMFSATEAEALTGLIDLRRASAELSPEARRHWLGAEVAIELGFSSLVELRSARYANALLIERVSRPEVEPPLGGRFEVLESSGAPHVRWTGSLKFGHPTEYTVLWSRENGYTDDGRGD